MILLSGFLEVLLKALALIGFSISVGGVVFSLAVLRGNRAQSGLEQQGIRQSGAIIAVGALLQAFSFVALLLVEPWALADDLGKWPVSEFLSTGFARVLFLQSTLALLLAAGALRLWKSTKSLWIWFSLPITGIILTASGAWAVHGASRLEGRTTLMAVTALHQLGAAIWAGGIFHLALLWRLVVRNPTCQDDWPRMVARFSPLAMRGIALVLATGCFLAVRYVGRWYGITGTAYGSMVVTKGLLLSAALLLGGMNFVLIGQWRKGIGSGTTVLIPPFCEAEACIGIVLLVAAASLTSQPPAVDILSQCASPAEVWKVFAPKIPRFTPPPYQEMLAQASSSLDLFALPGRVDRLQSNFNHNISGLLLLVTALAAMAAQSGKIRWARNWPLLLLLLAAFLIMFAEPNGWPFGYEGFWETLVSPGVLQHRLATLVVLALSIFQWRVETGRVKRVQWRYAFPILCAAGGALLLSHSHTVFAIKWAFLVELSHLAIGLLAVLIGVSRWLELRLPSPINRLPSAVWPVCMMLTAYILLVYREI